MIKRIVIVIIVILIVLLGRGFFYYSGFYQAPTSEMPIYEQVIAPAVPSTEFSDIYEEGEGIILIDLAHGNSFDIEELNVLTSRLVSRGLTIKLLSAEDDLKKELLGEEKKEDEVLEKGEESNKDESLEEGKENNKEEDLEEGKENNEEEDQKEKPPADAFTIVCPQEGFSNEEKETINEFVNNGGKLLLIADPTRRGKMNSLSLDFGLIFEPDYLYNMKENEINYRNIFVSEFKENEITKNIGKIALYTAGTITSVDGGIAFVDENTFSSLIETRRKLSPIALAQELEVLAIHDLTFLTEPYNGILDNNQLISNIADWLTSPAEE